MVTHSKLGRVVGIAAFATSGAGSYWSGIGGPPLSDSAFFSTVYVGEAIKETPAYRAMDVAALRNRLDVIAAALPQNAYPNESQTEDDLIWPVVGALRWSDILRQRNLTVTGREREEIAGWGSYGSCQAMAWINALMAGQPDAGIPG